VNGSIATLRFQIFALGVSVGLMVIACSPSEKTQKENSLTGADPKKVHEQYVALERRERAFGNWIGIRLREQGGGASPPGAQVIVHSNSGRTLRQFVTGDSYRAQHANTVHFGLGQNSAVEKIEVPNPQINRYHNISLPERPRQN
jgi:hypothetical protein